MKNSINNAFKVAKKENRPALISYTVCGDYTKDKSLQILNSISPAFRNICYSYC